MSVDIFQLAAANARKLHPLDRWYQLPIKEQAAAIYREMQTLDAAAVAAIVHPPRKSVAARPAVADPVVA